MARKRKNSFPSQELSVVHPYAAGIDIGSTFHVVALPPALDDEPVRTFGAFTHELHRLADWLVERGVTTVAMESTGVYWKPIWNILEGHMELLLVNARHLKTVPGRKTDVNDCEWIAQLMQYGLLKASFVPPPQVRQWRDLTRHRTKLSDQHTAVVNRLHKVLEDGNIKLSTVVSDVMGVSGRRILRELASGETDPKVLSALGDPRLRATPQALQESLLGHVQEHHRFMLEGLLDQVTSQG